MNAPNRVTIRLNTGIQKQIKQVALNADVTSNEVYSQAVEYFLDLLKTESIKIKKPKKSS